MEPPWRDKYERLGEEHRQLKRHMHELKLELKRTTTKLRAKPDARAAGPQAYVQSLEHEKAALTTRVRSLELRLTNLPGGAPAKHIATVKRKQSATQTEGETTTVENNAPQMALVDALRSRLTELAANLARLGQENALLQDANEKLQDAASTMPSELVDRSALLQAQSETTRARFDLGLVSSKLADAQMQLQAQATVQAQTLTQLDALLSANTTAQAECARLRHVEADANTKDATIQHLREDVCQLRNESLQLHALVGSLSSTPFGHDSIRSNIDRLMLQTKDLEEQNTLLDAEVANERQRSRHLDATVQTLKHQVVELQKQLQTQADAEASLRTELAERSLAFEALSFQVGVLRAPTTSAVFTSALAIATKQRCHPSNTPFLLDTASASSIEHLEAKLARLTDASAPTFRDVARLQQVANTYKELNADLEMQLATQRRQFEIELQHLQSDLADAQRALLARTRSGRPMAPAAIPTPQAPALSDVEDTNELRIALDQLDCMLGATPHVLVLDYGAFESQVSPRLQDESPLAFATSFAVVVDAAFFAASYVRLELHALTTHVPTLTAVATLSLEPLFASITGRLEVLVHLMDPRLGTHVASLRAAVTLASPVSARYGNEVVSPSCMDMPPSDTSPQTTAVEISLVSLFADPVAFAVCGMLDASTLSLEYSFFGYLAIRTPLVLPASGSFHVLSGSTQRHFTLHGASTDARLQTYALHVSLLQDNVYMATATIPLRSLVLTSSGTKRHGHRSRLLGSFALVRHDDGHVLGRLGVAVTRTTSICPRAMTWQPAWWATLCLQFQSGAIDIDVAGFLVVVHGGVCFQTQRNRMWAMRRGGTMTETSEATAYIASFPDAAQDVVRRLLFVVQWSPAWLAIEDDVLSYWRLKHHRLDALLPSPSTTTMPSKSFQETLEHAMY
ncbi:hypothetical protein SDRG_03375 [Saprolegnia diclina VS20]|uniref:Uncharacterized protein n=1 Tax=Saprolegnia diclina (strain VS20) TaxID=1156394 RepID=T0QM61_SAPDV|nr:hypothetical protein SDRG_03375 [Saprolegnia diclina VS20]EQC39169.1 hypothetical protein SDRG_03375 [Saprolegnia diclina VS20]|eukprot:XP_008607230.1 hypothetical protein SDRG_03375 [Saprolegnia diclina VS20]